MRTAVWNAKEYMLYELRYVVVPFLWKKEVYIVQQWKEQRDDISRREHAGVRDEIWNVAEGRLNAAVLIGERRFGTLSEFSVRALAAFLHSDLAEIVVSRFAYLPRCGESPCERTSALAKLNRKLLPHRGKWLPKGKNRCALKCEYGVLYVRSVDDFPLFDGLFFVEGHGTSGERVAMRAAHSCDAHQPKTIVPLQATKARSHHTETGELLKLKPILRRAFEDWDDFSKNMRWEIVYVQHPDAQLFERRQRCDRTEVKKKKGGETGEEYVGRQTALDTEQVFWETEVDQYAVKLVGDLLAALDLCLSAKWLSTRALLAWRKGEQLAKRASVFFT
ncbi:hypothetical protein, conserved in T. vivax [Trypanosoma vivax Y486]|uniref:Retrotransposon hot spot (RHS) protein n=1 Tax=Trypanosoma vivax (strain Y486) TaxID=1055687 RepID=F9WN91_TRYVY|nr:hypothetical protein, conserved in T. vivax [Trypanosoma vivax Y486]|eukprot:CCD19007.1 hypothetical protein, conserved in T. vivax [Trypanosoma vivax Y486]